MKAGAWKFPLAVAALAWMALGLYWAHIVAVPHPLLPPQFFVELFGIPDTTRPERFFIMLARESSLLLAVFALLGLALAASAWRSGSRRSSLVAALSGVAVLAVSLAPMAQAYRVASSEGIPLSLHGNLSGFSYGTDRSPQTVSYSRPSEGGEELRLDIWQPDGNERSARKRPAIVMVHGGGWRSGTRSQFARWNDWLAGQGYVVFDIDYRLAPPPSWQEAPADVRCAVRWVKANSARYNVDPERIALMGRSAGGHLALLTAYEEATPMASHCAGAAGENADVAAVAAFYPPTNLTGLSQRGYLGGMDTFIGGGLDTTPERYRSSSPIAHLNADAPPTFLAHGGRDEIVPVGQSRLLAERLKESGVPHHLVELPWANHTFDFLWGGWGTQITRPALDEFLSRYLKPPRQRAEPSTRRDQEPGQNTAQFME
jgi:acetyl esterase